MSNAREMTPGGTRARDALWIAAVVIAGLFIPAGGFLVVALSRLHRFRPSSPPLWLLLATATAALVVQLLGMYALGGSDVDFGPATRVR